MIYDVRYVWYLSEELALNQDNPKAVEDSWGHKRATPELLTNSVGGK